MLWPKAKKGKNMVTQPPLILMHENCGPKLEKGKILATNYRTRNLPNNLTPLDH